MEDVVSDRDGVRLDDTDAPPMRHAPALDERRRQRTALACIALYLAVTHWLIGLRTEHVGFSALIVVLILRGGKALDFLVRFSPVALTGITYDFFRLAVPLRGEIHVSDLYRAELATFGIGGQIPADWLLRFTHPAIDLVTGVAYIVYLFVPMVTAVALFWVDRERMLVVGWAFLLTNLVGMVVYIAYPAAPPWYVADYGLGPAVLDAAPSAAGASRFDALIGISYFESFYSRSANVFGAMPSLHVAYPTSTLLAMSHDKRWAYPLAAFVTLVSFAALYLQHHYVFDVLAGLACATVGFVLARWVMARTAKGAHA